MMETKVFIVLCSLLFVNFGSTNHDEDHADGASSSVRPLHVPQAFEPFVSPASSLSNTTKGLSGTVATAEESTLGTPDSKTASDQPTHNTPQAEPPKPQTISPNPPTTTSTSPPSTSLSAVPTLTPRQTATPAHGHPEAASKAPHRLTTDPPSSAPPQAPAQAPAQAPPHADSPAQINARGDTIMVHNPPTLDPLLAGLVSAFIITAVIITLLLFLKLRQRDTRPEFRRLQDLPMDDMEDTPLSMCSY